MKARLSSQRILCLVAVVVWSMGWMSAPVNGTEVHGPQSGRWILAASPYVVTGEAVIPAGQTLTIDPGVVVKFSGYYSLKVEGTLIAIGADNNRIAFTSANDGELDPSGAAGEALPTSRDWKALEFMGAGAQVSRLEYCILRYSDKVIIARFSKPTLKHIIIADCGAPAFVLSGRMLPIPDELENDYSEMAAANLPTPYPGSAGDSNPKPISSPQLTTPAFIEPPAPILANSDQENQNAAPQVEEELLSGEEFSFGEVNVVSATRTLQNILQAPSAISALRNDEVLRYGQPNLADLFRMMPGVEVFTTHAGNLNVNSRGYNRLYSNRTLVLIDDRIVYTTFFGTVFWNTFPLSLQDIKSIEVIRGPSGSLYGANAVSGVINISTKRPQFRKDVHVRSFLGTRKNSYVNEISYGGILGKWAYLLSGSGLNLTNVDDLERLSVQSRRVRAYLERTIGNDGLVSFEAGAGSATEDEYLPWGPFAMPVRSTPELSYYKLNLRQGNLKLQSYLNLVNFNVDGIGVPFHVDIDNSLAHNSLEYTRRLGSRQTFVAGAEFRRDAFTGNVTLNERKSLDQYSLFLQDAIALSPKLTLTLGGRIDHKPLTTTEVPLRAALVYSPRTTQSFRVTAAQGFRSPSLVEYFVVSQFGQAHVLGSTDLGPEKAHAIELGYRGLWADEKVFAGLDFFREELSDFVFFDQRDSVTISFANGGQSSNFGGEAELGLLLPKAWRLQATYSFQKVTDEDPILGFENSAPRSKVSLGLHRNPSQGLFLNLWTYYSGATTWNIARPGFPPAPEESPAYFFANAYGGYALNANVRLGMSILNLANNARSQFPFGERLERTFFAGLEASF